MSPAPSPSPADPTDVAAALADDLERIAIGAVGLTTRMLAQAAPGVGLSFPQWRTLLVVGSGPHAIRVSAVAGHVGATLPATGRLLRRLEGRGLVVLAVDPRDRRATVATLTPEGARVRSAILATRRARLLGIAATLPPAAQRDLAAGLRAVADALEAYA